VTIAFVCSLGWSGHRSGPRPVRNLLPEGRDGVTEAFAGVTVLTRVAAVSRFVALPISIERLSDDELAAVQRFGRRLVNCYIGVLDAIAATLVRTQARVSRPQPRKRQFSFIKPEQ
jgi:hypothetical protein